jgi:tyrosyl-tRNA synthetase
LKAQHIRKLTAAGFRYTLWVGDWFAMINNKLDADLKKIQSVAKYMIEVRSNFYIHVSQAPQSQRLC